MGISRVGSWMLAALSGTVVVASGSLAFAQAAPSVNSWLTNVPSDGSPCCQNQTFIDNFPPGRAQTSVSPTITSHPSTGVYVVTANGAAPLPSPSGAPAGYYVQVTAVNSAAVQCFEVSSAASADGNDIVSTVNCVNTSGTLVNSNFQWSYRTDSFDYVQSGGEYTPSFGYAQVNANGTLVNNGVFNAGWQFEFPAATTSKLATGRYKVTFPELAIAGAFNANNRANIHVAKMCGSSSCRRNVCMSYNWGLASPGESGHAWIEVRCYNNTGALTDTAFRVFAGAEAANSQQYTGDPFQGRRFGWFMSSDLTGPQGNAAITNSSILATVWSHNIGDHPNVEEPLSYYHTATGKYGVAFPTQAFYEWDSWSIQVVSRATAAGTFCNIQNWNFTTRRVNIACYTGAGVLTDSKFVVTMRATG
jgi:hypothetical protein